MANGNDDSGGGGGGPFEKVPLLGAVTSKDANTIKLLLPTFLYFTALNSLAATFPALLSDLLDPGTTMRRSHYFQVLLYPRATIPREHCVRRRAQSTQLTRRSVSVCSSSRSRRSLWCHATRKAMFGKQAQRRAHEHGRGGV